MVDCRGNEGLLGGEASITEARSLIAYTFLLDRPLGAGDSDETQLPAQIEAGDDKRMGK